MRRRIVWALIVWASLGGLAKADLRQCIEATCRIHSGNGVGTGVVFEVRGGELRILTNYHVAEGRSCKVEFWRRGHQSQPISATSKWHAFSAGGAFKDLNVLSIPVSAFGGSVPSVVPLAASSRNMTAGSTVASVGCPSGAWPTAWLGHVAKVEPGVIRFRPAPQNGRSGSALFDEFGRAVVGIVGWRDDEGGTGIAMSADYVRDVMAGKAKSYRIRLTGSITPIGSGRFCECGPDCPCGSECRCGDCRDCIHGVRLGRWCEECYQRTQGGEYG